jgi:hypothetical protein
MSIQNNQWIQQFYATYTFEIDFVLNRNEHEVINTLGKIYKQQATIRMHQVFLYSLHLLFVNLEIFYGAFHHYPDYLEVG